MLHLARITLVAASVLVSALILEFAVRAIPLWPDQLSDFDPTLGMAHIPGAKGWWINVAHPLQFRTYVEISSQGLHDRDYPSHKEVDGKRILLLGDSITDALEVNTEDNFAKQLESMLNKNSHHEVINGGHIGYGTDQELVFYRSRGHEFSPDIVILCFTPGNDIENNMGRGFANRPVFSLGDSGALALVSRPERPARRYGEYRGLNYQSLKDFLFDHFRSYQFIGFHLKTTVSAIGRAFPQNFSSAEPGAPGAGASDGGLGFTAGDDLEHGWALTQALILELSNEVYESGGEFVLAVMPDPRLVPSPSSAAAARALAERSRRLAALCGEHGLHCVDTVPLFESLIAEGHGPRLFIPNDGHPTAEGHLRIAQALNKYLSDSTLVPTR